MIDPAQLPPDFLYHLILAEDLHDEARRACAVAMLMQCNIPPIGDNYQYIATLDEYLRTGKTPDPSRSADVLTLHEGDKDET